jgi:Polyketide cyclase / dehydrase and lipid transport
VAGVWETEPMSAHSHRAHIDAPIEVVWDLVGSPPRYPAWWPRVIEVQGERFEEGDEYAQVVKAPGGEQRSGFLLDRRDELKGIRITCRKTGMFAEWSLTEALGGTFVELEMGIHAHKVTDRIFDTLTRGIYFRRWSEQSVDALDRAARSAATPATRA